MQNSDLEAILRLVLVRMESSADRKLDFMNLVELVEVFERIVFAASQERPIAWEPLVVSAAESLQIDGSEAVFSLHNRVSFWGVGRESKSGYGSSYKATRMIRRRILPLLESLGVSRLLDAPCGDFHWAASVNWSGIEYMGIDIDRSVIEINRDRHGSPNIRFLAGDLTKMELEPYDAVLCRDCLFHLPLDLAKDAIQNFQKARIRYLLSSYFPDQQHNSEIDLGGWYPINLRADPFNLPEPIIHFVDDPMPLVRRMSHTATARLAWRLLDVRSRVLTGRAALPLRFLGVWDMKRM